MEITTRRLGDAKRVSSKTGTDGSQDAENGNDASLETNGNSSSAVIDDIAAKSKNSRFADADANSVGGAKVDADANSVCSANVDAGPDDVDADVLNFPPNAGKLRQELKSSADVRRIATLEVIKVNGTEVRSSDLPTGFVAEDDIEQTIHTQPPPLRSESKASEWVDELSVKEKRAKARETRLRASEGLAIAVAMEAARNYADDAVQAKASYSRWLAVNIQHAQADFRCHALKAMLGSAKIELHKFETLRKNAEAEEERAKALAAKPAESQPSPDDAASGD